MTQRRTTAFKKLLATFKGVPKGGERVYWQAALSFFGYRYLAMRVETVVRQRLGTQRPEVVWQDATHRQRLQTALQEELGFYLEPQLWPEQFLAAMHHLHGHDLSMRLTGALQQAMDQIAASTTPTSRPTFVHLFDGVDLDSLQFGGTAEQRIENVSRLFLRVYQLPVDDWGTVYEDLLQCAAAQVRLPAGSFYTPRSVSTLQAGLVDQGQAVTAVYDPTMGTGSSLILAGQRLGVTAYYGQELMPRTASLAQLNLLVHGVSYRDGQVAVGDVLTADRLAGRKFAAIVATPPVAAHWDPHYLANDPRFTAYEQFAPKSKADWAFVEHMLAHLTDQGCLAVVLPVGSLFRQEAEGVIRRQIVERDNLLDAVISLPTKIGQLAASAVVVFRRGRTTRDVWLLDATGFGTKQDGKPDLAATAVTAILDRYHQRQEEPHLAHLATLAELRKNAFDLSVARYVAPANRQPAVNVPATLREIQATKRELAQLDDEYNRLLAQLVQSQDAATTETLAMLREMGKHDQT